MRERTARPPLRVTRVAVTSNGTQNHNFDRKQIFGFHRFALWSVEALLDPLPAHPVTQQPTKKHTIVSRVPRTKKSTRPARFSPRLRDFGLGTAARREIHLSAFQPELAPVKANPKTPSTCAAATIGRVGHRNLKKKKPGKGGFLGPKLNLCCLGPIDPHFIWIVFFIICQCSRPAIGYT